MIENRGLNEDLRVGKETSESLLRTRRMKKKTGAYSLLLYKGREYHWVVLITGV